MRGVLAGALTLIVLQVVSADNSKTGGINGPVQAGRLLGWVSTGVHRLISGDVAAIPTTGKSTTKKTPAAKKPNSSPLPGQSIPE